MSNSALASLTAQYTDSENENEDYNRDSPKSGFSQVIIPQKPTKTRPKQNKKKKSVKRLVSYQDDTIVSDSEDNNSPGESKSDEQESDGNESNTRKKVDMTLPDDNEMKGENKKKNAKYAKYGFSLPPEPKGKPSPHLIDKFEILYDKMRKNNMDMNRAIQDRKEFRNPSIYEKLIQFCDINEFGTNYPPEIYDPLQWGAESYYDELARVQKNDMLKRQKDRKEMDKIEQATAVARKVEEEAKRRKSKWDQPAPIVKASVTMPLTTTVTGTKGTVISAFGSLPKKPIL